MTDDLVKRLRLIGERQQQCTACYKLIDTADEAADRIDALEKELYAIKRLADVALDSRDEAKADVAKLERIIREDNNMLRTYHKWCDMNGCAPSSSDLISARAALGEKKE